MCRNQQSIRISSPGPCRSHCHYGFLNSTTCLCPPGFWRNNLSGCQQCDCSSLGSYDCHPMTGECKCKAGFHGPECSDCPAGESGCREPRAVALTSDTHVKSVVIDGVLGQFCLAHGDCTPRGAECRGGTCHCQLGYKQQSPIACAPSPPHLCSFSPCEAGGTCEEHDGTFTCHCGKGRTGKYCQQEVEDTAYTEAGLHCVKPNQEFCHKNFPSEHSTLKD